ncbi:MAG TPA: hypothetical protein ENG75_02240 [Nitrospirae bacterium]|nr:hypothetical protein BMS3Bbin08_01943 [bacterium BMS3Bbin08]HDH51757.1 hypothetical protein [Nitrospirota bacterium]HDK16748.1 hypothetical protein [Nitrospirota bacterium]
MELNISEIREKRIKKLVAVYYVIFVALIFLASLLNLWLAYKIGSIQGLDFGRIIALHKSADIERIYQGYEVIIIQRLGASLCYFLLGIAVALPYLIYRWTKPLRKRWDAG